MATTKLRFLKTTRLHGGRGIREIGEVADFEGTEDELDALLRGPEPCAEKLSAEDLKAIGREAERAAKRKAAKEESEA